MATDIDHACHESKSCCCSTAALEPDEDCPVHSGGPWPPRCEVCGKFLPWSIRDSWQNGTYWNEMADEAYEAMSR